MPSALLVCLPDTLCRKADPVCSRRSDGILETRTVRGSSAL